MSTSNLFKTRARTKIVATIGPACRDAKVMAELVRRGADVFRVNMAHGDRAEHEQVVATIRQVSEQVGRPIGILIDLAGPKIRLGQLQQDPLECTEGQRFTFIRGDSPEGPEQLVSNYERLVDEVSVGDPVMLADGTVSMQVEQRGEDSVTCRVTSPGTIRSRQGINLPGVRLSVPTLTERDWQNARWAADNDIDFIGVSFVRSADEIHELKAMLDEHRSPAQVVAKIEKPEALEQLDAIIAATDVVMVARGDLGVEIDVARMPVVQKQIIAACRPLRRPVIVATQMLDSMQHSRRPTRAETTDVANAILDGADACMLSGETAVGDHPREAVSMMNRIMLATEELLRETVPATLDPPAAGVHPITSAVVFGSGKIAQRLDARLVVVVTRGGATARVKSKQRDFIRTIGVSDSPATLRRMCLYWGITPLAEAPVDEGPELRRFIDQWGLADGYLHPGDRIIFVAGTGVVQNAHNLLVVHEVKGTA